MNTNNLKRITDQINNLGNINQRTLSRQLAKAYMVAEWMADIECLARDVERPCMPELSETPILHVSGVGGLVLDDVAHLINPVLEKRQLVATRGTADNGKQCIRITEKSPGYHTYQAVLDIVLMLNIRFVEIGE